MKIKLVLLIGTLMLLSSSMAYAPACTPGEVYGFLIACYGD